MSALTRWRFGRNRRLVIAVTCVPMPPCFLGLPLRQTMLPFIGPLPVNSQNLPINALFLVEDRRNYPSPDFWQGLFLWNSVCGGGDKDCDRGPAALICFS